MVINTFNNLHKLLNVFIYLLVKDLFCLLRANVCLAGSSAQANVDVARKNDFVWLKRGIKCQVESETIRQLTEQSAYVLFLLASASFRYLMMPRRTR